MAYRRVGLFCFCACVVQVEVCPTDRCDVRRALPLPTTMARRSLVDYFHRFTVLGLVGLAVCTEAY